MRKYKPPTFKKEQSFQINVNIGGKKSIIVAYLSSNPELTA